MSIAVERPIRLRTIVLSVLLLFAASGATPAATTASATQSTSSFVLSDGRTTVTLTRPPEFREARASSQNQRVLETNDSSTQLSILPADQPTDPAAAAAFVENTNQSLTAARGADLLAPPAAEHDENFALVMHYRVRALPEAAVDTTMRWRRVGPVMVQAVTEVRSQDAVVIKAINDGVADMLNRASVEGYQEATAGNTAGGANAGGAAAPVGATQQRFAGDTVEFTLPPLFEQISSAKSDTSRDYLSSDHAIEMIVTLLPAGTPLDSASGPIQLSAVQRDLKSPSAVNKPTTGPVLLKSAALPVEIQWSFTRDGKPAQAFRLFRKIHPKQVVSCEITTIGDAAKAQQLGEETLNSMTSLLPPDPVPAPPVAKSHGSAGSGPGEEKRNQRAQAALDQAKKLADAKKDDDAYAKYRYIVSEYPNSPSAAEAKAAMDKYEADPAFAERHKKPAEAGPAEKAAAMLALADNYSYVGRADEARAKYQQVIKEFPDTPAAEKAKKRMADVDKTTNPAR